MKRKFEITDFFFFVPAPWMYALPSQWNIFWKRSIGLELRCDLHWNCDFSLHFVNVSTVALPTHAHNFIQKSSLFKVLTNTLQTMWHKLVHFLCLKDIDNCLLKWILPICHFSAFSGSSSKVYIWQKQD